MKEPLPDKTVILIILATIILVFSFIFTLRPTQIELEPSIQWKDSSFNNVEVLRT